MHGSGTMDDGEWISITEAAQRLTAAGDPVDRSTLSRYLKQHSEALQLKPSGKSNLVDYEALVAHRRENIRIRPAGAADAAPVEHRLGRPAPRFAGSQSDGAARKAQADAELREMDLALRRKQLTPTSEVDQAGRDAVALMQSAFERAIETEASAVSLKYGWDERTVRIAFKAFAKIGLDVFHREILERLDSMRRSQDADEPLRPAASEGAALQ
jgi:hypothetical protein